MKVKLLLLLPLFLIGCSDYAGKVTSGMIDVANERCASNGGVAAISVSDTHKPINEKPYRYIESACNNNATFSEKYRSKR